MLTVIINVLMLVSVFFLMSYVQKLLNSDVQINLTEVVTQNKDVITSKLKLELNQLDMISAQIQSQLDPELSVESIKEAVSIYSEQSEDYNVFVSNKEGEAYFGDGTGLNIAGRSYFKLSMEGKQNVSDRLVSRVSGEDIFVSSVPLTVNGEIVGAVQKCYTLQEMYAICSISLFSEQGYMYIINRDGYILISSNHSDYNQEDSNYIRDIYAQGNREEANRLKEDINKEQSGFMETTISGKTVFSAYTPVEEIHEWYLISSVDTDAVSPNANSVIKMFYFILIVVAAVFGASLFGFLYYQNQQHVKLEHIAFVDSNTMGKTYNKFIIETEEMFRKNPEGPFYLLAFDIDNFKYINNFYGFDFGDFVLRRIHDNVSKKLGADEIIARISSDHFIVLLKEANKERIAKLLEQDDFDNNLKIYLSSGLYIVTDSSQSVNLMVDKASTAAQTAKGSLNNKIATYSEEYGNTMMYNEQLKRQIELALDRSEIIPFYQPKVDINTKQLVGAEALARWRTPEGKMISPGEFIPLCEKTGQIIDVDFMVFNKVLDFLAGNIKKGVPCVPISVNFSRLHLLEKDLISKIVRRLEAKQVPAKYIQVELTESVFFDNMETINEFVEQLHEKGLLVCIDDFGSGYSSLNMLKDIPIDVLKIDKGFLDKTEEFERQSIILSTIVTMAERLNIDLVVEGVETAENVNLMNEIGCNVAQGYYFARPMEEEKFTEVFERGAVI